MNYRINAGGSKSFVYSGNEDYGDTDSTREFKESYDEWQNMPKRRKWHNEQKDSDEYAVPIKLLYWLLVLLLISICVLGYQNKSRIAPLITDFFEEDTSVTAQVTIEEPIKQEKKTIDTEQAVVPTSLSVCEEYSFSGDKYDCYIEQAVKTQKSSICKLLPEGYLRNNCYTTYAIENNDISACAGKKDCVSTVQAELDKKRFEKNPSLNYYYYTLNGVKKRISFTTYGGLNDYLASLSQGYTSWRIVNNKESEPYLKEFVEAIKAEATTDDDRAKIAISLVQHIPYDIYAYEHDAVTGRYPYEVLYDGKGVCGEKSQLLAYILRELGYGVVLFNFDADSHMAAGVKCPKQYSYEGTGYCFIETTTPTIITYKPAEYIGGVVLGKAEMSQISDGKELTQLDEEYKDAVWMQSEISGRTVVDAFTYYDWRDLVHKYGLEA